MKKTLTSLKFYLVCILILITISSLLDLRKANKALKVYRNNQAVLLDSIQKYKVNDSLNAASVELLTLTKAQLEAYRAEDAALIKKLKADILIKAQAESNIDIRTRARDTIIIYKYARDTLRIDSVKVFDYKSKWTDVRGSIIKDSVRLQINNREELLITQSKVKKKLGFIKLPIWLFGYRTTKLDVISKNPNTKIQNIEFVYIK